MSKRLRSEAPLERAARSSTQTDGMGHAIKRRQTARDVFITPLELAKKHIAATVKFCDEGFRWFDPFKNSGNYYNNFPSDNKVWCEILEGRDFFESRETIDVICSNPPYSIMDAVFAKSRELKPKVISYLIGVNNLTTKRMEEMNKEGYVLVYVRMLKVFSWFGMSFICIWKKCDLCNVIDYDRKVYRLK